MVLDWLLRDWCQWCGSFIVVYSSVVFSSGVVTFRFIVLVFLLPAISLDDFSFGFYTQEHRIEILPVVVFIDTCTVVIWKTMIQPR